MCCARMISDDVLAIAYPPEILPVVAKSGFIKVHLDVGTQTNGTNEM